jgi:hypothetical protein
VDGVGGDAPVVQRTAEAATRGVFMGMRASEARSRAPGAAFLAHRPDEHARVLAEIASRLSSATGLPVSVGVDALFIPLPAGALGAGERTYAQQLVAAPTLTSGLTASVAGGETAEDALAAARFEARRGTGARPARVAS